MRDAVISALFVDNPILQPKELCEYLLLPHGIQTLFIEMNQTLLICINDEFSELQVWSPLFDSKKYGHVFLFIRGETLCARTKWFAYESEGVTLLQKHCAYATIGNISFYSKWLGEIRYGEDWGCGHCLLQCIKS